MKIQPIIAVVHQRADLESPAQCAQRSGGLPAIAEFLFKYNSVNVFVYIGNIVVVVCSLTVKCFLVLSAVG